MNNIISNYMNNLSMDDVKGFAIQNGVYLSDEELVFVYHFVKGKDLASLNAGSAVPSMTTNILNAMQLYIPDDETLCFFEETVTPMYAQMQENEKQSVYLTKLRDTLLPRLMSGELDVSNIEL